MHSKSIQNPLGSLALLAIMVFSLTGCLKDKCDREVTYIKPIEVYKTADEIRKDITTDANRGLTNPGKIYNYDNYIFINEVNEGVHIYNNKTPENPTHINFIAIPGNNDISIKDNVLFADNYIDLLTIDISDPSNPTLLNRLENVFPADNVDPIKGFLVDYVGEEVTEKVECSWQPDPSWRLLEDSTDPSINGAANSNDNKDAGGNIGTAGSMARFSIVSNMLYVIDNEDMFLFNLNDAQLPVSTGQVNIGLGIETIYPYNNMLFIGANDGMYIYDNVTPENPRYVSKFEHFTACDPVVAEGDYAYVTLRSGNPCGFGWRDELQVVDISDLSNPFLVNQYRMSEPKGLAIDGETLYLCDGFDGIKTYDVSEIQQTEENGNFFGNENELELLNHESIDAYDVILIPDTDILMVVGEDGLYQYDRSETALRLISQIPLN